MRETDLAGCLLGLAERADISSYLEAVMLTDGGDEPIESAALPKVPLSFVGIGADPASWNDLALSDVQAPAMAEKDVDFEVTADLQARAGHGQGFAQRAARVRVTLEHATSSNTWERLAERAVDLSNLRARARLPARSSQTGLQRYRVSVESLAGELSLLNNSRTVAVNVQKKALHVLYFASELGQEFKLLRNELGRDPGLSFTALLRTAPNRFTLQGDRWAGDEALGGGFPSNKRGLEPYDAVIIGSFPAEECAPQQAQALMDFVEGGGTAIFLGGDKSFGRGGYARTSLAALFPWRLSELEPEPEHGAFPVGVPPMGLGHPILASVQEAVAAGGATLDSVNLVQELKPGATALLDAQVGARRLAVIALQPFGKGKVLGIASNTLWRWATQPEPLRSAYGLFWRQAIRNLAGRTEGGQNLAVRWDRDFYRPGEQALGEVRVLGAAAAGVPHFTATLTPERPGVAAGAPVAPVSVEPLPGQAQAFQVKLRFRERGQYAFRLVASQAERVLETYEKSFAIAPRAAERLEARVGRDFSQATGCARRRGLLPRGRLEPIPRTPQRQAVPAGRPPGVFTSRGRPMVCRAVSGRPGLRMDPPPPPGPVLKRGVSCPSGPFSPFRACCVQ